MNTRESNFSFGLIITFFSAMFIAGCGNSTAEDKTETTSSPAKQTLFDKLTGTWQNENSKDFERWTKKDDGTFQSVAFSINGNDTSWNENARIYPENDKWIFENTVKGQNDGKAVKFTSSILNDNSVQFSNPAHDFPTDINYTIVDENTLHAFIIGPNDKGGKDTMHFNSKKIK